MTEVSRRGLIKGVVVIAAGAVAAPLALSSVNPTNALGMPFIRYPTHYTYYEGGEWREWGFGIPISERDMANVRGRLLHFESQGRTVAVHSLKFICEDGKPIEWDTINGFRGDSNGTENQ